MQHQAYFSPVMGQKKIYFFPDAECLTDVAANSFLKMLEEAPSGIIFLFTAVRLDNILPTIRSRCQVFHCYPVPAAELEAGLERLGYSHSEAERRSILSQGLPGIALREEEAALEGELPTFNHILEADLLTLFKLAEDLEKKERKAVISVLVGWQSELRKSLLELGDEPSKSKNAQRMAVWNLEKLAQALMMCETNVNMRMLLEELFISIKLTEKRL
jgi:DNA polymerase-3 subunit delta'